MENKQDIWYCIMNPTAGKHEYHKVWNEIENGLKNHSVDYRIYFTKSKKDAEHKTIKFIEEGFRNFIAIGGDGTVHEVVNGMMKQKSVDKKDLLLAVIPIGTGNDWAKHHGITADIDDICKNIINKKTGIQDIGITKFISEGKEKIEYFNNVAGMAYDAFVVEKLEQRIKKPNKLNYILSILKYLFQYKLQKAKIFIKNEIIEGKFYTINVGICKFSGGGMSLVPHAIHDDGLFAVTIAGNLSKIDVILNTYRFYNFSLTQHPKIKSFQVNTLKVEGMNNQPIALELDGEMTGYSPVEFSILTDALRFIDSYQIY